jgi:hypothetical protein
VKIVKYTGVHVVVNIQGYMYCQIYRGTCSGKYKTASLCVDDNLRFLSGESKKYDAFINHNPQRTDDKFYPAYIHWNIYFCKH